MQQQPNMNGDSLMELIDQQSDVREAALELIKALSKAKPHGRNYQTLENGLELCQEDRKQSEELLEQVRAIADIAYSEMLRIQQ